MALLDCCFYSNILGVETRAKVILPYGRKGQYPAVGHEQLPVLYLLHGLSEDDTAWTRRTSLERYVMNLDLAVIMPDAGRSFYMNMESGGRYFDYISQELPALMQQMFPISSKREDCFIAGLSMGGYGAFKAALSFPESFAAAASLSGAVDIQRVFQDAVEFPESKAVFGEVVKPENDLRFLAEKAAAEGKLPALYQYCGTKDFLYEDNTSFRDFIRPLCPDYSYREDGRGHEWEAWEEQLLQVLDWLREQNRRI